MSDIRKGDEVYIHGFVDEIRKDVVIIKNEGGYFGTVADEIMPSARPEPCEDAVSREAVSSWLKQYGQDVLHGKYKFSLMYIWKNLMDLPSAQPERVKCKDCKEYYAHDHRCRWWNHGTNEAGWCSYAERR